MRFLASDTPPRLLLLVLVRVAPGSRGDRDRRGDQPAGPAQAEAASEYGVSRGVLSRGVYGLTSRPATVFSDHGSRGSVR